MQFRRNRVENSINRSKQTVIIAIFNGFRFYIFSQIIFLYLDLYVNKQVKQVYWHIQLAHNSLLYITVNDLFDPKWKVK